MNKEEQAVYYKTHGCNCCQAILKTYKDELNLSEETLDKMGSGFGLGMGGMEATCGALCGAMMVAGLKNDTGIPTRKIAKEMVQEFKSETGAVSCEDLKGVKTHRMLSSCEDCVRCAVRVVEEGVPQIVKTIIEEQAK